MKITLNKKNNDIITIDNISNIEVLDTCLIIKSSKNDTVLLLDNVSTIIVDESDYFVYTGKEYNEEMKVDYQEFCMDSDIFSYETLNDNHIWNGKKHENKQFVICDGMLDIIPKHLSA